MSTFGPAYDPTVDEPALTDQRGRILRLMLDVAEVDRRAGRAEEGYRTLDEISRAICAPPASVSSQLRHLRKAAYGSWVVDKRRKEGTRQWEYRVLPPKPQAPRLPQTAQAHEQGALFA